MDENVVQVQEQKEKSYFDGTLLQRIGWVIAGGIVTLITLGICFPVAVFWIYNWETKHTVINGRRLKFTGTAGGFFGKWLLCFVLTIVTAGIYSFFVPIKIKRWREENTFFEDELTEYDSAAKLKFKKASKFDGNIWQFIGLSLLGFAITVCSFGICYPWSVQLIYKWNVKHTVYCEKRCSFDGTALQLFGTWIKWLLLTIITLGIYGWWLPVKIKKWIVKHTVLEGTEAEEKTPDFSKEYILKNKKPLIGAVAIFVFTLNFVNIALPKVGYEIFAFMNADWYWSGKEFSSTMNYYYEGARQIGKPCEYLVIKLAKRASEEFVKDFVKRINKEGKENEKLYKSILKASKNKKSKNLNQQFKMIQVPGKNYEIAETEVTQELFFNVTGLNPSHFKGEKNPVEWVSWYEAIAFCNALSKKCDLTPCYKISMEKGYLSYDYHVTYGWSEHFISDTEYTNLIAKYGKKASKEYAKFLNLNVECDFQANGFRLPTIDEWDYAAKGGKDYKFAGSDFYKEVAWFEENSEKETHPVAQKKPNDYGLYDMSGNVGEWFWSGKRWDGGLLGDHASHHEAWRYYHGMIGGAYDREARHFLLNDGWCHESSSYWERYGIRLVRTTK